MKKLLNTILLVCALFSFVACGNSNKAAEDAAKQAEVQKQMDDLKEQVSKLKDEQDGVIHTPLAEKLAKETEKTEKVAEKVEKIEDKTVVKDTNLITIDTPKDKTDVSGNLVTFEGTVTAGATKIVAKSSADNDPYTLKTFKADETKFNYKASLNFKNLKVGQNTFEFTAYFKDGSTKTANVTINFSK